MSIHDLDICLLHINKVIATLWSDNSTPVHIVFTHLGLLQNLYDCSWSRHHVKAWKRLIKRALPTFSSITTVWLQFESETFRLPELGDVVGQE